MRYKILLTALVCMIQTFSAYSDDVLVMGNMSSERSHHVVIHGAERYDGMLGQTALRLLPLSDHSYKGGSVKFRMKVEPDVQNYCTVRFAGDEADRNMMLLYIEGKQIGYRHLGDIDYLSFGNGSNPLPGRFYYVTLPLPMKYTQNKKEVELEIKSFGPIWGYGENFERYQKVMTEPCVGLYKVYTHTSPAFEPERKEKQGSRPADCLRPDEQGEKVMMALKERVNKELRKILQKDVLNSQLEMWTLAEGYRTPWTDVYHHRDVIPLLLRSFDAFYNRFKKDSTLVYRDKTVYNYEWLTTGPMARAIRMTWPELKDSLSDSRLHNYVEIMTSALDYAYHHRRQYTNQSMIIDLFMYDVNKALLLMAPFKALPEYQTLRYLHESVGLCPWSGIDDSYPLGKDYWQLTSKGLTKELGFVGYYGEVLDWVCDIYRSTCVDGQPGTGDEQIRAQLIKIAKARSYFRYPAVDDDGYRCMRIEALVGWRDSGHYPGEVAYGDRGQAWDGSPLMTAALTLDPEMIGMAQQMLDDHQFFTVLEQKMKEGGLRVTRGLMQIPEQYERIKTCHPQHFKMPMDETSPDFVFADEEDGVVAVKNGSEILYASLYWRARYAVNNLAKVHFITPYYDVISNIFIKSVADDSGLRYVRPDWLNLAFSGGKEWYEGESAHAGDTLVIAKVPATVPFRPGQENVFAGRALYYEMSYGAYIVAMNASKDQTFSLTLPTKGQYKNLTMGGKMVQGERLTVGPMSTVVLYRI